MLRTYWKRRFRFNFMFAAMWSEDNWLVGNICGDIQWNWTANFFNICRLSWLLRLLSGWLLATNLFTMTFHNCYITEYINNSIHPIAFRKFIHSYSSFFLPIIDNNKNCLKNVKNSINIVIKKKDQTGIEPVTLGPAIPCSTTELLVHLRQ